MLDSKQNNELLKLGNEITERLRAGEQQVAEAVLNENLELSAKPESALELIYTEFVAREELGHTVDPAEYAERFPHWRDRIKRLFVMHRSFMDEERAESTPLELPHQIPGYRIIRRLGTGGMGVVYLAEQLSVRRQVALKVLHPFVIGSGDILSRFHREAVILGMLSHKNIASIYASGVENNIHYLAMQHCLGESLQTLLDQREGRAPLTGECIDDVAWYQYLLETMLRVTDAMQYAHEHGVLHRDIKPSNIMVRPSSDEVWIVDFGLAKVLESDDNTLTAGGLGTLGFSSPEQLAGYEVNERSDIYSMGATFKRLLSRHPEDEPSLDWLPNVPSGIKLVLERATDDEPELRYPYMSALRTDLLSIRRGQRPANSRLRLRSRVFLFLKRHRLQAAVLSLLIFLLVVVGGLYSAERHRSNRQRYQRLVEDAIMNLYLGNHITGVADDSFSIFFRRDNTILGGIAHPHQQALNGLDIAISLFERRPEARYYRARALQTLGRSSEALSELGRLSRVAPDFAPADLLRHSIRQRRVNPQLVNQILSTSETSNAETITPNSPESAPAITLREHGDGWEWDVDVAHEASLDGRWLEAEAAYTRILNLQGDEPFVGCLLECSLHRSAALIAAGRYQAAIEDLGVVRANWPTMIVPGLLMGKAYLLNNDMDRADEVFRDVHRSASLKDVAALFISDIYQFLRYDDHVFLWLDVIEDDFLKRFCRAVALHWRHQNPQAEDTLRKLVDDYPVKADPFAQLATILRSQGRFHESVDAARKAIEIDPTTIYAQLELGRSLMKLGEFGAAQNSFRTILKRSLADAHDFFLIGDALIRGGKTNQGLALLKESIRLNPRYSDAHSRLGSVCLQLGRSQEALIYSEKAARLSPVRHGEALAMMHYNSKRWCDCFNVYLDGVASFPADARVHKLANEFLVFLLERRGQQRHRCDRGGFHVACGGGERLVKLFGPICRSGSDSRLLSILAMAYCYVPERRDYSRAFQVAVDSTEAPENESPWVREAFAEVMRRFSESPLRHDNVLLLEHLSELPPYFAIDVLLELDTVQGRERWDALIARFDITSRGQAAKRRLDYLVARINQRTGRFEEAIQRLAKLLQDDPQPEVFRQYVECLRSAGQFERHDAVLRRVESLTQRSPAGLRGLPPNAPWHDPQRLGGHDLQDPRVKSQGNGNRGLRRSSHRVVQWDFTGNLEPTVGPSPLSVGAAAPVAAPVLSFERLKILGHSADVARFSRGTYFQFWHHFTSNEHEPLQQYTLIMDVSVDLDGDDFAALFQPRPQNDRDAKWSVHRLRGIGMHDYGGKILPRVWYRLARVIDLEVGEMCSYVNGRRVQRLYEDYHLRELSTMYSSALIFADDTEENTSGFVNSIQFRNYAMTPIEVAALGGPSGDGIPIPSYARKTEEIDPQKR